MDLNTIWFILIAVLSGYFLLEGFDFGVGMLLPFLGKNDAERRQIINSIGPFWDGNEVWLLTAGGAIFAAFPHWYATMFSGFYLALALILVGLIVRGVAFVFRSQRPQPGWRRLWDGAIFLGSLFPSLLCGIAAGNLFAGLPINSKMVYVGGFWGLFSPASLLTGILFVLLFSLHGANFLALKVDGEVRERARRLAGAAWFRVLSVLTLLAVVLFFVGDPGSGSGLGLVVFALLAVLSFLAGGWYLMKQSEGWAFAMIGLTIVFTTAALFVKMYPRVMISTLNPQWSLTVYNASSSTYTLQVMLVVAVIFVPLVLLYQGWTYWVFRKRVSPTFPMEP